MRITDKSLVEQQQISESELKQRLQLFRLTSSELVELRSLKGVIVRQLDSIVAGFYEHQTNTPDVETLIGDAGTLQRLMSALRQYVIDLFSKEVDLDYVEHRLRIGLVHKRIGVDPKLYLSAVSYLKEVLSSTIRSNISDTTIANYQCEILSRLMDFDVSYVFDTYIKSMMNEIEMERNKSYQYVNELEEMVRERTKHIELMASQDPLTNLYNKRAFEEVAEKLFTECHAHGDSITVLYMDIDSFKAFNDNFGHEEGDNVLIAVADAIRGISRGIDKSFRFGGDEFVVLMPSCKKQDAQKTYVPRLIERLAEIRDDVSISIGVSESTAKHPVSMRDAVRLADQQMYRDKKKHSEAAKSQVITSIVSKQKST
ncbi:GGDEF domain-containing protein [Vibrio scophthalmi]|uniref:GGDEF domain-containing protein n=1 Tax=Vibrio scophthalmi TaxID=45658 RepID=UPI002FF0C319